MTRPVAPKTLLSEIRKSPGAYIIYALLPLIGYAFNSLTKTSTGRTDDCKEQVAYLRRKLDVADSVNNAKSRDLDVARGVIDAMPNVTDSLLKHR